MVRTIDSTIVLANSEREDDWGELSSFCQRHMLYAPLTITEKIVNSLDYSGAEDYDMNNNCADDIVLL